MDEPRGHARERGEALRAPRQAGRQRDQEAAQDEQQLEFIRQLAEKVQEKCNDEEIELLFPGGRRRSFNQIISWAR